MSVFLYAVVEFLVESTVDVVHKDWIESSDEDMFCYWPPTVVNIYNRVRNGELPDKERWNKYKIRIFNYTDDFDKAVAYSKRAELTSNVESDDQERQRKKPKRYQDNSDEENGTTGKVRSSKKVNAGSKKRKINVSHSDSDEGDDERETKKTKERSYVSQTPIVTPKPPSYEHQTSLHTLNESQEADPIRDSIINEPEENYRRIMLQRTNQILDNQKVILTTLKQLTGGRGAVDVEQVIEHPLNTVREMNEIQESLKQDDYKKKLMLFLSSLGGHSSGDCLRRILRSLGTNKLWSIYSLKGRKGKLAFEDHPLCRIAMKACIKVYPKTKVSEMEDIVIDYLKQAPHKQGGTKYKKPEPSKTRTTCIDNSDSSGLEEMI